MNSEKQDLVTKVSEFIEAENLLDSPKDKVLIAISGGVDSMVLLDIVIKLGISCGVAHCNYQLRDKASEADAEFVEQVSQYHRLHFHLNTFDTRGYAVEKGISIQMAARALRYQWFNHLCNNYGYHRIATAHHLDDLVETVLMNFVKGTGIKGMQGILPKQGKAVRPLLFAGKKALINYAEVNRIQWREDESNQSIKYQRNFLRHNVIQQLKELNPSLENTVYDNVQHFRDFYTYWEEEVQKQRHSITHNSGELWYISIEGMKQLKPLRLFIFEFLHPFGFNQSQIRQIQESLDHQPGSMFYTAHYQLEITRGNMIVAPFPLPATRQLIRVWEGSFRVQESGLQLEVLDRTPTREELHDADTIYLDLEQLSLPLVIRNWQEGDCFYPLGMDKPKKLSDFFIDEKQDL